MRLYADAVEFVLDEPCIAGELRVSFTVRNRRGQHETDRRAVLHAQLLERSVLRGRGRGANVATGHQASTNTGSVGAERGRDRVEHEPLAQSNAQIPSDNLDHVGRDQRIVAGAQDALEYCLAPAVCMLSGCLRDFTKQHVEGCRRETIGEEHRIDRRGHERPQRGPEIARRTIARAQGGIVKAPEASSDLDDRSSTDR